MRDAREWRRERRPRAGVALVACLALLAPATEALAFCRSATCGGTAGKTCEVDERGCPSGGPKLFWPTSCVSYATNKLGTTNLDLDPSRAVIRKAFEAWSDVRCPDGSTASMTFQEREPVSCKKSEFNPRAPNVNVVMFQDTMWKYRGVDATLAKTSVTYSEVTGEIFDADIEINTAFNDMTITDVPEKIDTDLQAVVTHEVGHFIGLAHSPELEAVMYASYPPHSTSQRYLAADDVAAICATYPANNGLACMTEPRNGFSGTCDDPPAAASCSIARTNVQSSYVFLGIAGCLGAMGLRSARRASLAKHAVRDRERS